MILAEVLSRRSVLAELACGAVGAVGRSAGQERHWACKSWAAAWPLSPHDLGDTCVRPSLLPEGFVDTCSWSWALVRLCLSSHCFWFQEGA